MISNWDNGLDALARILSWDTFVLFPDRKGGERDTL
jgi:hypothetical protein